MEVIFSCFAKGSSFFSAFNVATETSVTCWLLCSQFSKVSACNEGGQDKKKTQKRNPQTCTIFAHHTLLEILEQKNLGFEERGKKSKEGYHDSISLRVGCGWLPQCAFDLDFIQIEENLNQGLCRTASSCCPPGSWRDATECRGSCACVLGGVEKGKWETIRESFALCLPAPPRPAKARYTC